MTQHADRDTPGVERQTPDFDDRQLARRAQQGDLDAFEQLLRAYQRPLHAYLWRITRNTADAEELTQIAFIRAWKALGGFRHGSTFKTWLYRIATNAAYNHRTRTRPTEQLPETLPAPPCTEPAEQHNRRVREQLLHDALDRLPPDQRAALILVVYEQMSYKQVGQTLGKTVRAVDALLTRAKANLRQTLHHARVRRQT